MLLAQFNVARIRYPLDDPRMAEFVDMVDSINVIAERMPGFVWRMKDETGHAMNMGVNGDKTILPNLTLWTDPQSLHNFVFKTIHSRFFDRGKEWFLPWDGIPNVMWWVEDNHRPTLEEGIAKLEALKNGASKEAFDWDYLKN